MKRKNNSYVKQASKEYIAIVDKNDKIIRKGTRGEADKKKLWRRIVFVVILNQKGQILMQQRSRIVIDPLKWTMSAAGHVDYGESYLQSAKRETLEEIGIKIKPKKFIKYVFPEIRRHYVGYYAINKGPFRKNREVKVVKWMELSEVKRIFRENPSMLRFTVTYFLKNHMKELEKIVKEAEKH